MWLTEGSAIVVVGESSDRIIWTGPPLLQEPHSSRENTLQVILGQYVIHTATEDTSYRRAHPQLFSSGVHRLHGQALCFLRQV